MRNKAFPHTAVVASRRQRVASPVPVVEVAEYAHVLGIWRPHREMRTFDIVLGRELAAELVVQAAVRALLEQIDVLRRKQRSGARLSFEDGRSHGFAAVERGAASIIGHPVGKGT